MTVRCFSHLHFNLQRFLRKRQFELSVRQRYVLSVDKCGWLLLGFSDFQIDCLTENHERCVDSTQSTQESGTYYKFIQRRTHTEKVMNNEHHYFGPRPGNDTKRWQRWNGSISITLEPRAGFAPGCLEEPVEPAPYFLIVTCLEV